MSKIPVYWRVFYRLTNPSFTFATTTGTGIGFGVGYFMYKLTPVVINEIQV